MPHITIKLYPDRTREQKQELSDKVTKAVMDVTGCRDEAVSVDIVDVKPEDWTEKVYNPEILPRMDQLIKKPGYDPD